MMERAPRPAVPGLAKGVLALLLLAPSPLAAQRYFFENVSVQQGLPASKVYCAAQGADGTIWIGTEAGLASYDGHTVSNHGTAEGVAEGGVRALLADASGGVWAGHTLGGLTHFDGHRFRSMKVGPGITSAITGVVQDKEGRIWIATVGQGAWKLDGPPADGTEMGAEHFGDQAGIKERLFSMTLLNDGRLAFVEDGGTLVVLAGGRAQAMAAPRGAESLKYSTIFQDHQGNMWLGTRGGGAFRTDAKSGRVDRFDIGNGMRSNTVFCFGEDGDGNVWIGTVDGGIAMVTGSSLRTFDLDNGLHSRFVRCVVRDREGNLLIGTDGGLDIFKGDRFVSYGEADGLHDTKVFAVMEGHDGSMWFGTNDGFVIIGRGGTAPRHVTVRNDRIVSDFIRSMKEDDKGYVWIGTEKGLMRYDPRTGRHQDEIEVSGSLVEYKVTALEIGQPGEIWVGGVNGVRRYLPGSGTVPTVYTEKEGLAGNSIMALHRDRDGVIWVGSTVGGVTRIDNGKATHVDLGRSVAASCFVQDPEGRIWVGTDGQGIIVLKDGREAQHFTTEQGLLSNNIRALAVDGSGHVWIGTNKGLNKWRHKKEGFIAFTERAGFTGIEVKPNAACALSNGGILFGTVNGATRVGNEKDSDRAIPPLVTIRGWKVNLEDRPLDMGVSLGHTERNVRFMYGSVALSDPDAVRYQYMLEGLDDAWQPMTRDTEVNYPVLPPGRYAFRVKAMDRTGEWTDPPAELRFTIHPPWYRSWWFYTALAIFVGASLFSYIKVRERQLRLRNLVLEKKVEERTAEVVAQSREIEGQKERIEDLLLNILPKEISEELKEKGKATARRHEEVTVMFTDMKGFTRVAEKMTPEELVSELDDCFIRFDDIIGRHGLEKIKTIGDSYMCAGGVPTSDAHHADKAVLAALEVRELMAAWKREREAVGKEPWVLRIGVHTGPVVAGVVGKRKFAYDIWGDTVNTASRMESSGEPGEVNISGSTYQLVKDRFECVHRGQVEAKNKGRIDMYFVRRIRPEFSADDAGIRPNGRFRELCGIAEAAQQLA